MKLALQYFYLLLATVHERLLTHDILVNLSLEIEVNCYRNS